MTSTNRKPRNPLTLNISKIRSGSCLPAIVFLFAFMLWTTETYGQSNALHFDGENDRVEIADANSLDLAGSYTLECWVNPTGFNALGGIISKYHSNNADGYILRLTAAEPYSGINFDGVYTPPGVLQAGVWQHIAAVNNGGTRKLYVNGIEVTFTGGSALNVVANDDNLVLGMDYQPSPRYFNGALDEVRIWNTARTQVQIQQDMNSAVDPGSSGLVAYYKMNTGVANGNNAGLTEVTDATENANHGTATGFAMNGNTSNWTYGYTPDPALYVDAAATGYNNGSSWENAFTTLAEALVHANNHQHIHSIHVAEGTYYPTGQQSSTNRNTAFVIGRGDIRLYGGYPSGGGQRNIAAHPVYLDGNISDPAEKTDNSYHILVIAGLDAETDSVIVDGFTFRNSHTADGYGLNFYNGQGIPHTAGGGITVYNCENGKKIMVRKCTFTANEMRNGSGILSYNSAPLIENCRFSLNKSYFTGGGIQSENNDAATIVNCLFEHNTAGSEGGGYYNVSSPSATVTGCLFVGNTANWGGGIFTSDGTSVKVTNCTFAENAANNAGNLGGAFSGNGTSELTNCIFWDNGPSPVRSNLNSNIVSYSIIQGGYTGTENTFEDPEFNDPENGDYTLSDISPAINTGTTTGLAQLLPATDLAGNPRINDGLIDRGAYENNPASSSHVLYVDHTATGDNNGTSWTNAYLSLADAMLSAAANTDIEMILVAEGVYKPEYAADGVSSDVRDKAFVLPSNVKILGGFQNGGGARDITAHATTLSGDIGTAGVDTDNCYHVIVGVSHLGNAELDGFTITKGYGLNASNFIVVNFVNVTRSNGAAIQLVNTGTSFKINNCIFHENTSFSGGAVYNNNARL